MNTIGMILAPNPNSLLLTPIRILNLNSLKKENLTPEKINKELR